jgi:hypothetical protein
MKKTEKCLHCNDDYIPKRRGIQKFCTNSCRSRYWYLRQEKDIPVVKKEPKQYTPLLKKTEVEVEKPEKKKEGMTWGGVGNAAVGTAAVKAAIDLFTPENRKPATKGDVKELKSILKGARYFPVRNLNPNKYGENPYYDIETGNVIYG